MAVESQLRQSPVTELPMEGSNHPAFAAMGLVFTEGYDESRIKRHVTTPEGWLVNAAPNTPHRYQCLLDDRGRRRAVLLYKRDGLGCEVARMSPCRRFEYNPCNKRDDPKMAAYVIGDNAIVEQEYFPSDVHVTEWLEDTSSNEEKSCEAARQWIREHGGDPDDPSVGWD